MMPKSFGKLIDVQRIPLRNMYIKLKTGVFVTAALILSY